MGKVARIITAGFVSAALLGSASAIAQEKTASEKKKTDEEIIIRKKGDTKQKMTIVIEGDSVTINGKPVDDFKGENIMVLKRKGQGNVSMALPEMYFSDALKNLDVVGLASSGNNAILGVVTEKAEDGAKISEITKASGAEKAGLKVGDVITAVNSKKIVDPEDLVKAITPRMPNDKITVTYKRDGKSATTTATLSRRNSSNIRFYNTAPGDLFSNRLKTPVAPRAQAYPKPPIPPSPYSQVLPNWDWNWTDERPRLGASVQDTEDGKGVKVIEVEDDSPADKAGIREDDVIISFEGRDVKNAETLSRMVRDAKNKTNMALKLTRRGKTVNVEVKVPKKLKTADL